MGKNGCNNVGVTMTNLFHQDPITTTNPIKNIGNGFLPFLNNKNNIGIINPPIVTNQNSGA